MGKKSNLKIFGNRLKELRKSRKLTQAQLAEKLDMSTNFIGMVERGERNTTIDNMFNIIRSLEISFSEFYKDIK